MRLFAFSLHEPLLAIPCVYNPPRDAWDIFTETKVFITRILILSDQKKSSDCSFFLQSDGTCMPGRKRLHDWFIYRKWSNDLLVPISWLPVRLKEVTWLICSNQLAPWSDWKRSCDWFVPIGWLPVQTERGHLIDLIQLDQLRYVLGIFVFVRFKALLYNCFY